MSKKRALHRGTELHLRQTVRLCASWPVIRARPELPECECGFVLQDTDGEGLMPRDCPEIRRGKAENGKLKIEIAMNADQDGRWKGAPTISGTLRINLSVPGGTASHRTPNEILEMPESWSDFVLHDADGEGLMRQKCPEIEGKAKG